MHMVQANSSADCHSVKSICSGGFILYRTSVPAAAFADEGALLDLGAPVHDYATVSSSSKASGAETQSKCCILLELQGPQTINNPTDYHHAICMCDLQDGLAFFLLACPACDGHSQSLQPCKYCMPQVFLDGNSVGVVNRNFPRNLTMPVLRRLHAKSVQLDILVHALGRVNFGCVLDMKGLQSANVLLNGIVSSALATISIPVIQAIMQQLLLMHASCAHKLQTGHALQFL